MKTLILAILMSSTAALACLPHPNFQLMAQNQATAEAISGFGLLLDEIRDLSVTDFNMTIEWTYTDSSFMCHDTEKSTQTVRFSATMKRYSVQRYVPEYAAEYQRLVDAQDWEAAREYSVQTVDCDMELTATRDLIPTDGQSYTYPRFFNKDVIASCEETN